MRHRQVRFSKGEEITYKTRVAAFIFISLFVWLAILIVPDYNNRIQEINSNYYENVASK